MVLLKCFVLLEKSKMYKNVIILLLILITSLKSGGQEQQIEEHIDPSLLIEDYNYLLKTLEETHPNLYAYIPKDEFISKTDIFRETINKPLTRTEFYKIVLKTIALVKQGHTMVFDDCGFRKFMDTGGLRFPFSITYDDGHIYVDENYSTSKELAIGTEIIAINRIPVSRIIDRFTPYLRVRPNGYIEGTMAYNWPSYLWLEYGFSDKFTISYILPQDNKIRTIAVNGVKKEDIDNKRKDSNRKDFEFNIENETAIMTINTFLWDYEEYDSLLNSSFTKMKASEIKNLIIDVRKNGGGNGSMVDLLMDYLTDKPYITQSISQVKTSEATKKCYTTHPIFVNAIEQARKVENSSSDFLELVDCFLEKPAGTITTFQKSKTTPNNKENKFDGQLYVLTSNHTFSAATYFSVLIKDNSIGYLVGEETSDNPSDYGCFMWFELPNTKINIQNSTRYDVRPAGYDDKKGVIPDFKANQTYRDYVNGFDRVMNYTFWLIEEGITN